jgi:signal transduction histidine kinase
MKSTIFTIPCAVIMAIVKHLMRLHGGTVRIESELGEGTSVTLLFSDDDVEGESHE